MFSADTLQKFAREVAKYPAEQKQSAVMACLAHAQEEKGWLPPEAIEAVANYLGMPPIAPGAAPIFVLLRRCPRSPRRAIRPAIR